MIEQFSNWIGYKNGMYRHHLTESVKQEAFQVASRQRCKNICKLIVDVYELKEDKHIFVHPLHDLLQLHMYKEVSKIFFVRNIFLACSSGFDRFCSLSFNVCETLKEGIVDCVPLNNRPSSRMCYIQ